MRLCHSDDETRRVAWRRGRGVGRSGGTAGGGRGFETRFVCPDVLRADLYRTTQYYTDLDRWPSLLRFAAGDATTAVPFHHHPPHVSAERSEIAALSAAYRWHTLQQSYPLQTPATIGSTPRRAVRAIFSRPQHSTTTSTTIYCTPFEQLRLCLFVCSAISAQRSTTTTTTTSTIILYAF